MEIIQLYLQFAHQVNKFIVFNSLPLCTVMIRFLYDAFSCSKCSC